MVKKLKPEHQIFIVQALACFRSPSEVVEAVNEEFGLEISRQHVRRYNPEQSQDVATEWKELFEKTRKEFIAGITSIGIAHQSYRLAELQEIQKRAKKMRNYALAAQIIEQAAKERGGQYTNKVRVQVSDKRERLAELLKTKPEHLPEEKPTVH